MLDQAKKNTGEVEMKSAADIKVCHATTVLHRNILMLCFKSRRLRLQSNLRTGVTSAAIKCPTPKHSAVKWRMTNNVTRYKTFSAKKCWSYGTSHHRTFAKRPVLNKSTELIIKVDCCLRQNISSNVAGGCDGYERQITVQLQDLQG